MKPPSNVTTPAQYIASLPADRATTIATLRTLVNKHIPRGYDECLVSSEKWIEMYEQSRLMTKAGQVQMARQGAPSASKVAAKRVDTKRRR